MKKLGLLAMAFALAMTMTQCKKENTTTSNDNGAKVPITLNVSGNSGSRVAVTPETGVVTFEDGDVLYVASNGVYVGTMTYNGTVFSGEINEPTEGQKLQFYFLGNVTPAETMTEGSTAECSVVISDQTEYLPVISYAPSRENYQIGKTDYNATLLNKCALVKFNATSVVPTLATSIKGMNNKVTVDFTDNSFAYSQEDEGFITLPAGEGERWAILLPQNEIADVEAYSSDGIWTGTCGSVPAIAENDYLNEGITVEISHPTGSINSLFTINSNGDQVWFSQGNLQYNKTTNEWSFMEHQYDMVETNEQDVGENYANQNIVSLFGWGTSGYNHGANAYQPWSTSTNYSDYYAYGAYTNNLYDGNGQADWGYNAIFNGGNEENSGWRTMTGDEWDYVFTMRNTSNGIRFAYGMVNNVNGVILLPDEWDASTYDLNGGSYNYESNTITANDWTNTLEANGAVFLPAAGSRSYSSLNINNAGSQGSYWSSSRNHSSGGFYVTRCAYDLYFYSGNLGVSGQGFRTSGFSVRLVRSCQ